MEKRKQHKKVKIWWDKSACWTDLVMKYMIHTYMSHIFLHTMLPLMNYYDPIYIISWIIVISYLCAVTFSYCLVNYASWCHHGRRMIWILSIQPFISWEIFHGVLIFPSDSIYMYWVTFSCTTHRLLSMVIFFTYLVPGGCGYTLKWMIFRLMSRKKYLKHFLWNCSQVNATRPNWSLVKIGTGNDYNLVLMFFLLLAWLSTQINSWMLGQLQAHLWLSLCSTCMQDLHSQDTDIYYAHIIKEKLFAYLMHWDLHIDYRALDCKLICTWNSWFNLLWPRVPYGDTILDQLWLWFWLVAWWHQAITWTSIDLPSNVSCVIHLRPVSQKFDMCSMIVPLKLWTHPRWPLLICIQWFYL